MKLEHVIWCVMSQRIEDRRAPCGMKAASIATATNNTDMDMNVIPSSGVTPKSIPSRYCVIVAAPHRPVATPMVIDTKP